MYRKIKRILGLLLAILATIILLIPILIICLLIKTTSKGSIFFKQERVGQNNKNFIIYKFRTMRIDTPKDIPTHLLDNPDLYITKIGAFLRKTSLDEIPQLINIIKGEMAFVGPRPSLPIQKDLNTLRDKNKSSSIRPGLTGLAQISGRDELEIHIKADYDGLYYEKMSLFLDIKIFFLTFINVVKSDGIKEGKK